MGETPGYEGDFQTRQCIHSGVSGQWGGSCAYCSKHSSRPGMLSISSTFRSGRRRAITYLLTPYNHHRHTTVSSSASHRALHPIRMSTHAPVSGTDFDDRAAPARPSSECLVVGYGSAAGWRCFPSHPHSILLLPLTYLPAYGCSGSAEGSAGAKVQGVA